MHFINLLMNGIWYVLKFLIITHISLKYPIVTYRGIKARRLIGAGHVARRGEGRSVYKVWVGET
jgi:hypothetical protein